MIKEMKIEVDCHIHTKEGSDSTLYAAEAAEQAVKKGLRAIFITNHESTEGIEVAQKIAQDRIEVLPGIELRTDYQGKTCHILGLLIDIRNEELNEKLERIAEYFECRSKMLAILLEDFYGIHIREEFLGRIAKEPKRRTKDRLTHILVEKGMTKEKIKESLGRASPVYVEKYKLPFDQACDLIRSAGGIPVLAHPGRKTYGFENLAEEIPKLKKLGLLGIEVFHPKHTHEITEELFELAKKHKLLITGGSDTHGILADREIGCRGIPYSFLEKLKEKKKEIF